MVEFDWQVIGQIAPLKFLEENIKSRRLGHAYLFCGPHLIGKTTVAKRFFKFLICENFQRDFLTRETLKICCNECRACRLYERGAYPDFYLVEKTFDAKNAKEKQNISVNQIRELHEKIFKRSFANSYKMILIPEAENLSEGASNALLKMIEEPTPKTIFILITKNKDALLPTIVSRCQLVNFQPVAQKFIYDELVRRGASRNLAQELSRLALGRPMVAQNFWLQNEHYVNYKSRLEDITLILGASNAEKFRWINQFFQINTKKEQYFELLNHLSIIVRDYILLSLNHENLVSHSFLIDQLKKIKIIKAENLLKKIELSKDLIQRNLQPRMVIEQIILN